MSTRMWTDAAFRAEVRQLAARVAGVGGEVEAAALTLWRTAFSNAGRLVFAEGLWNVWGDITDEFTHSRGNTAERIRLSIDAAVELERALGEEVAERRCCDVWIYERLGIPRPARE